MRGAALRGPGRRIAYLQACFLLFFIVLAARAAHLTVVATRGEIRGKGQLEGTMVLPPTRGLIVDRNGVELALTIYAPSIYVRPRDFDGNHANLRALAKALGSRPRKLADRLANCEKNFTYVGRWVDKEVADRIEALGLPGVGIIREPMRAYPAGELGASLLGFANYDGVGVRGIEQMEDKWLMGSRVRTPVERDARGRLLSLTNTTPIEAVGGDVALTIDLAMQAEAETALRAAIEMSGAKGGTVISIDPKTGDILALAEAPGFNPNEFRSVDYAATRSPAFVDVVEPGSTLKAILVASALQAGAITRNQEFDTGDGTLRVPGKTIRDHRPYGVLDPAGVLMHSSNIGAVMIAELLGPRGYYEALKRFGIGSKTDSGFPFESSGLLRDWRDWKPVDQATISFGQGVSVTIVQLAAAMAVLAGDGIWRQPRLVSARRSGTGRWQKAAPSPHHRVVSPQVAASVLEMLEGVVSAEGTGRKAALANLRVAGKTGTAQKLDKKRKAYSQTRYSAWFMGAAPADDPKIVIVAMLDEPQGRAHGGGDVAAPLFASVAAGQLAHLGILTRPAPIRAAPRPTLLAAKAAQAEDRESKTPTLPRTQAPAVKVASTAPGEVPQALVTRAEKAALIEQPTFRLGADPVSTPAFPVSNAFGEAVFMPDFRGETVESVRRMAARDSIVIEIHGRGLAIDQSPTPGTVVVGKQKQVRVSFSGGERES